METVSIKFFKKRGGWKDSSSGKVLTLQARAPELTPQYPQLKCHMSSTLLKLQTNYHHSRDFKCCSVDSWDFLGSQDVHVSEFQVSEKPCHKTRWAVIEEWLYRTSESPVTLLTVFQTNPGIIPIPQTHFQHCSILPLWGLSSPSAFLSHFIPLSRHQYHGSAGQGLRYAIFPLPPVSNSNSKITATALLPTEASSSSIPRAFPKSSPSTFLPCPIYFSLQCQRHSLPGNTLCFLFSIFNPLGLIPSPVADHV